MNDDIKEFRLTRKVVAKLKNQDKVIQELEEGKTAQEILEFSQETMAKFYRAAYMLFENKRYEDASNAFLFLASLNLNNYEYWLGLGMATQMCHQYEEAIDAYELAALCDITSPVPYFYLAKCLFAIHDRESALQAIELAIETAEDQEEFSQLKEQALAAREMLLRA
jgi:type III secretion system low calcium response chaperone LcrH/SycD